MEAREELLSGLQAKVQQEQVRTAESASRRTHPLGHASQPPSYTPRYLYLAIRNSP